MNEISGRIVDYPHETPPCNVNMMSLLYGHKFQFNDLWRDCINKTTSNDMPNQTVYTANMEETNCCYREADKNTHYIGFQKYCSKRLRGGKK